MERISWLSTYDLYKAKCHCGCGEWFTENLGFILAHRGLFPLYNFHPSKNIIGGFRTYYN